MNVKVESKPGSFAHEAFDQSPPDVSDNHEDFLKDAKPEVITFLAEIRELIKKTAEKREILALLFFYQILTATKLETEVDGVIERVKEARDKLNFVNQLSVRVQEHAQKANKYKKELDKSSVEGTGWETIEYLFSKEKQVEFSALKDGYTLFKVSQKGFDAPAFKEWQADHPVANTHLEYIYEGLLTKHKAWGDEWIPNMWYDTTIYGQVDRLKTVKPELYKTIHNEALNAIDVFLEMNNSPSAKMNDTLALETIFADYGFSVHELRSACIDKQGNFNGIINMSNSVSKNLDSEVQKLMTRLQSKNTDLTTITELLSNIFKAAIDSISSICHKV